MTKAKPHVSGAITKAVTAAKPVYKMCIDKTAMLGRRRLLSEDELETEVAHDRTGDEELFGLPGAFGDMAAKAAQAACKKVAEKVVVGHHASLSYRPRRRLL